MSHLKSRLSLASYREERRAAGLTLLILAVLGLTWSPHLAGLLWSRGPAWLHHLTTLSSNSYSVIAPVIFAFRSGREITVNTLSILSNAVLHKMDLIFIRVLAVLGAKIL